MFFFTFIFVQFHGYRLPRSDDNINYVEVRFGEGQTKYTYPHICVKLSPVVTLPSLDDVHTIRCFVSDLNKKFPSFCGSKLNIRGQNEFLLLPTPDLYFGTQVPHEPNLVSVSQPSTFKKPRSATPPPFIPVVSPVKVPGPGPRMCPTFTNKPKPSAYGTVQVLEQSTLALSPELSQRPTPTPSVSKPIFSAGATKIQPNFVNKPKQPMLGRSPELSQRATPTTPVSKPIFSAGATKIQPNFVNKPKQPMLGRSPELSQRPTPTTSVSKPIFSAGATKIQPNFVNKPKQPMLGRSPELSQRPTPTTPVSKPIFSAGATKIQPNFVNKPKSTTCKTSQVNVTGNATPKHTHPVISTQPRPKPPKTEMSKEELLSKVKFLAPSLNLDHLSVPLLTQFCKQNQIPVKARDKKNDICQKIYLFLNKNK